MTEKKQYNYKDSLKSSDTEEFIDLIFYRPLGYLWALFFAKRGISPNVVSVLSIFLGVAAGVLFYFDNLKLNILGMFFLIWANTYDSTDGQLARMTKQFSPIGRVLDGVCGDIWFITIYTAICMRLAGEWQMFIWILGSLAGYWHVTQAALADYYRNFHLHFLKGADQSEFSDAQTVKKQYRQLRFEHDFMQKTFLFFYARYTQRQENMTPCLQRLRATIVEVYPQGRVSDTFVKAFRKESKPLMKYTNMLSFNTRVIALFMSLAIDMPWLYFVFELTVLNLMLLYMYVKHEQMCTRFSHELGKRRI